MKQAADPTPYDLLGGETKVRELVDRFYDHMDSLNEVSHIRDMHAKSLRASREKLFLFLSGWLGGPDLYIQKYGHPRLRMRHMPFAIDTQARDQWLLCMNKALDDMELDARLGEHLKRSFYATADHMRNKTDHQANDQLTIVGSDRKD
jgi:hemoglobin